MPLWIERTPLFFARKRSPTRPLTKTTSLALANFAYVIQDEQQGLAQDHFETLVGLRARVVGGHLDFFRPSDFKSSNEIPSGQDAFTEVGIDDSGAGTTPLRVFHVKVRKRSSYTMTDELIQHEQIHLEMFALGCIEVGRKFGSSALSPAEKRSVLFKANGFIGDFRDTEYDDPSGRFLHEGTDHGRRADVQKRFWNSGHWVRPFIKTLRNNVSI